MLEKGTSGLMSGEGKRAAASRPRTALFLDSTAYSFGLSQLGAIESAESAPGVNDEKARRGRNRAGDLFRAYPAQP
jgi:hypothetical protein